MKKIIIVCVLVTLSTCIFSQEQKYGDLEFFCGMPFFNGLLNNNGTERIKTEQTFSFGASGMNYNVFNNDRMALVFIGSVMFPKNLIYNVDNNSNSFTGDDFLVFEMMWGVGYRTFETTMLKIPISLGIHILYISGTSRISSSETQDLFKICFGLGASAAIEYHINSSIYFFSRLQLSFDFLTMTQDVKYTGVDVGGKMAYFIDGRDFFSLSSYFTIAPVIGIGFKIDNLFNR